MNERQLQRQRRVVLVFLYLLFALLGAYTGATSDPAKTGFRPESAARIELLLCVGVCLGLTWFCTVDAKLVGKPLMQLAKVGIFLGWPIGVPIYLLWARGAKGLKLLLLHGFLLLLVSICAMLAANYVLFGDPFLV